MNLFEQMIDYIRAQQMYAYLNCMINNKFDMFTFLTFNYIVTDGFTNKERKSKQMSDKFKGDMFKSFIIYDKPNANDEIKKYYHDGMGTYKQFKTDTKRIINYDKFVEELNEQESR